MAGTLVGDRESADDRITINLLIASYERSPCLARTRDLVEDLRVRFVDAIHDPAVMTADMAEMFVTHEASKVKLRSCVGFILRSNVGDDYENGELFIAAGRQVLSRFAKHRHLKYDDSRGTFDSWLYSVWKRAALHANRRMKRGRVLVSLGKAGLERRFSSDGFAAEIEKMLTVQEVLDLIAKMPVGTLRSVMLDYAAGVTGAESARIRGYKEPYISRLRKRGLAHIRRKLGVIPPEPHD